MFEFYTHVCFIIWCLNGNMLVILCMHIILLPEWFYMYIPAYVLSQAWLNKTVETKTNIFQSSHDWLLLKLHTFTKAVYYTFQYHIRVRNKYSVLNHETNCLGITFERFVLPCLAPSCFVCGLSDFLYAIIFYYILITISQWAYHILSYHITPPDSIKKYIW